MDEPPSGNGLGSEDGPSVSLADDVVGFLEEDLSTSVTGSVSLLMSLRQLANRESRVRGSSLSKDKKVSRAKVVR